MKHIGSLRLRKGQKLFRFNFETLELNEVEIPKDREMFTSKKYLYFTSLNMENAKRKIKNMLINK